MARGEPRRKPFRPRVSASSRAKFEYGSTSDLSTLVAHGTTPVRVSAKTVRVVDAPPLHRTCREIRER